jgi:hypothetical protein
LEKGTLVTLTNDYTREGDATTIPISYSHIARDLTRGSQVLMADGAVMMEVLETYPERGTVECLMLNSAKLGERKNCNLPGVVVDLPTLTEKDVEDLVQFGVKHQVGLCLVQTNVYVYINHIRQRDALPESSMVLRSSSRGRMNQRGQWPGGHQHPPTLACCATT